MHREVTGAIGTGGQRARRATREHRGVTGSHGDGHVVDGNVERPVEDDHEDVDGVVAVGGDGAAGAEDDEVHVHALRVGRPRHAVAAGGQREEVDDAGQWVTSRKRAVPARRAHASSSKPNMAAGNSSISSSSMCAARA